jgi:ATP-dependent exoDNAse (exonuclease V) beta subunit
VPQDKDDDGIPLIRPISHGREGQAPMVVRLPSLRDVAFKVAELLQAAHEEGHAWGDMAILCRDYAVMDDCALALKHRRLPYQVRKVSGDYKPNADSIKVMTMKVSKVQGA